jgi:hypothetical protein
MLKLQIGRHNVPLRKAFSFTLQRTPKYWRMILSRIPGLRDEY